MKSNKYTFTIPDYLRKTLVFIKHYGKYSVSVFMEFFSCIDKTFILRGSLDTRLQFLEVLRVFLCFIIS